MSAPQEPSRPSSAVLATARSLAVDGVTAQVAEAFGAASIPMILLKGPTIADWLYPDASRVYIDSDLLVRPDTFHRAQALLVELGFERVGEGLPTTRDIPHAEPWFRRSDGSEVDLHRTLFGLGVSPEEAWARLAAQTEAMSVGGRDVDILAMPGRLLLIALHAAQHGGDKMKPLEDLSRAIEVVDDTGWASAASLAADLDATENFATGLRLVPAGTRMAERLDLVEAAVVERAAGTRSSTPLILGIERLARTRGMWSRLSLIRREIVPTPAFLRAWSPLARRGRLGLAIAYVLRPLWVFRYAVPSLLAWRRARRRPAG